MGLGSQEEGQGGRGLRGGVIKLAYPRHVGSVVGSLKETTATICAGIISSAATFSSLPVGLGGVGAPRSSAGTIIGHRIRLLTSDPWGGWG